MYRYAKGPISEGAVAVGDWGSYTPSREKAILENPQIFQNCEKNNFSSEYAQSTAERILNRSLIKKGCRTNLCSSLSCYSSGAALHSST